MGRFAFALTSFSAAVPAGILSAFLVMCFLNYNLTLMPMLLVGGTLAFSSFVVMIPFGIMVFGGPKKKKTSVDKTAQKKDDAAPAGDASAVAVATEESQSDILQTSGEAMVVDSDSAVDAQFDSSGEFDAEELEETSAFSSPLSSPDLESSEASIVIDDDLEDFGGLEEIEDEVILEDEDEDPKSKKKRR